MMKNTDDYELVREKINKVDELEADLERAKDQVSKLRKEFKTAIKVAISAEKNTIKR